MHTSKVVVVALITALAAAAGTFFGLRVLVGQGAAAKMVEVPSLAGMTVDQARQMAEAKELRLAIFERRPAAPAAGQVVKQVPLPGSSVPVGTATYVIVSTGPRATSLRLPPAKAPPPAPAAPAELVEVPRVRGGSLKRAQQALEKAGLKVGRIHHMSDEDRAPGLILKQEPKDGEKVAKDSAVELWLNESD